MARTVRPTSSGSSSRVFYMYSSARERLLANKSEIDVRVNAGLDFTKSVMRFFWGTPNSASDSSRQGYRLADYLEVID